MMVCDHNTISDAKRTTPLTCIGNSLTGDHAKHGSGPWKELGLSKAQADQPVENVGRELRKMMTFLKRNKEVGVPVAM